ncbi:hypothetical protein [Saccharothrix deserti]|uniref:hypothetical protein n=1 Tax=Saccharothrix deserti TaxID=2593674 RepID=UPI00131C6354|nr:hypothetical protein [Saccharothrix deserti]
MCRAGGRRCPNAGGRSTQNTRQAVSRARRALREAKQIGNPTEIDAARDRLDTARTAHRQAKDNAVNQHHHEDQDHAADPSTTAGHDGDVTPQTTPDDTTTAPSTPDTSGNRGSGFTLHSTNIAGPGAYVDIQAGVVVGSRTIVTGHHHEGQDHAADRSTTAGHDGDVTPPPTTDDTTTASSTKDKNARQHEGFTLHNTNIAHTGAHVGSQHDVTHGSTSFRFTAGDDRDVTEPADLPEHVRDAVARAHRAADQARNTHQDTPDRHTTRNSTDGTGRSTYNVAGGNDRVDSQVGFSFGGDRRHHGGSGAGDDGDVTYNVRGTANINTGSDTQDNRDHSHHQHDDTAASAHRHAMSQAQRAAAEADAVTAQARDLMRQHNIPAAPGGGLQIDMVNGRIARINGYRV